MILDEAAAVAHAATMRALWAALDRYHDAVGDLLEVRSIVGHPTRDAEAAVVLVGAALRGVRTCWALHFGEPPPWR